MAFKIGSINISAQRGAKLSSEFAARLADGSFPSTKTKADGSPTPTTVDDYVEQRIINQAVDSWIDRDGEITLASLKDKLKTADQTQWSQIRTILGA